MKLSEALFALAVVAAVALGSHEWGRRSVPACACKSEWIGADLWRSQAESCNRKLVPFLVREMQDRMSMCGPAKNTGGGLYVDCVNLP